MPGCIPKECGRFSLPKEVEPVFNRTDRRVSFPPRHMHMPQMWKAFAGYCGEAVPKAQK